MSGMAPRTGLVGPKDIELDSDGPEEDEEVVDRYRDGEPVDPRNQREAKEATDFDKFMDRIVIDERQRTKVDGAEDNPQRRRAARHQDRPMNRTRWGSR